jgi:hypothetical protein
VSSAIGLPGLFVVAWSIVRAVRRHRRRQLSPDAPKKAQRRAAAADRARVHIVLSRRDERVEPPVIAESEIPKVEHEGEWHTLH